jgi:hypothetical protein
MTTKAGEGDGCGCQGPRRRSAETDIQAADEKVSQTASEKSERRRGCCWPALAEHESKARFYKRAGFFIGTDSENKLSVFCRYFKVHDRVHWTLLSLAFSPIKASLSRLASRGSGALFLDRNPNTWVLAGSDVS